MSKRNKVVRVREKTPLHLRKRVPVACEKCRVNKSKCSNGYPCEYCKRNNFDCRITPVSKNSKTPTNQSELLKQIKTYSYKLEQIIKFLYPDISLTYLRNNIDEFQRTVYTKIDNIEISNDQKRSEGEVLKFNADESRIQNMNSSYALTTDSSFFYFLDNSNESSKLPSDLQEEKEENLLSFNDDVILTALDILPDEDNVLRLTEIFFRVCETNYFYVNPQQHILDLKQFLIMKNHSQINYIIKNWKFLVIVLGILATASGYEYIADEYSLPTITNSMLGLDDPGKKYYNVCKPFVGDLITFNNKQSAQALLLLGIFLTTNESNQNNLMNSTTDRGYYYIRLATEIAITNGLHLPRKDASDTERESNLRFWWSCYCLERRYGINLGKPEVIKREDIKVNLPSDCIELQKPDHTSNYLNQRAMIQLTFIIDRISTVLCSDPFSNGQDHYVTLGFDEVKKLLLALKKWKLHSPANINIDTLNSKDGLFRAHIHLRLNYLLAKLYLGKPFLLSKVENRNSETNVSSKKNIFIDHMTSICIDSAFKMIDLLSILKDTQKLGIYSSTDVSFCNLSLFVIVVFLKIDQSDSTITFLKKGLQILNTLSMGCAGARIALSRLQKLEDSVSDYVRTLREETRTSQNIFQFEDFDLPDLLEIGNEGTFRVYQQGIDSMYLPSSIQYYDNDMRFFAD